MTTAELAKEAVRGVVARINRSWRQADFAGLAECFDPNAVMVGPGNTVLGRGPSFFLESYREFGTNVAVLEYSESERLLEVFDDVAICAYAWTMTYQRDGGTFTENGTDQFVLSRCGPQWRVVCRYICLQPTS
jgi:uncharacterized protein (TIGR02246 family)